MRGYRLFVGRTPGGDGWAVYDRSQPEEDGSPKHLMWVKSRGQGRFFVALNKAYEFDEKRRSEDERRRAGRRSPATDVCADA